MKLEVLKAALGVGALRFVIRRHLWPGFFRGPVGVVLADHFHKAGRAAGVVEARKTVTGRVDLVIMLAWKPVWWMKAT